MRALAVGFAAGELAPVVHHHAAGADAAELEQGFHFVQRFGGFVVVALAALGQIGGFAFDQVQGVAVQESHVDFVFVAAFAVACIRPAKAHAHAHGHVGQALVLGAQGLQGFKHMRFKPAAVDEKTRFFVFEHQHLAGLAQQAGVGKQGNDVAQRT